MQFKTFTATKFNKFFSGQQPPQLFEWQVNQRFGDPLFPRHQGNDYRFRADIGSRQFPDYKDKDSPRNFCLLVTHPLDAAASLTTFYCVFELV